LQKLPCRRRANSVRTELVTAVVMVNTGFAGLVIVKGDGERQLRRARDREG
jgi:hypothetical protein